MSRFSRLVQALKHPRYFVDRTIVFLYENRHPSAPWITWKMVDILNSWLSSKDIGLEWGSGRSTLWLAHRVSKLISVETDLGWHKKVASMINATEFGAVVDQRFVQLNGDECGWEKYIDAISDVQVNSLDFCLVDGVFRDRCALHSLKLLRPGGIVVVDDVQRYIPANPPSRAFDALSPTEGHASDAWCEFSRMVSDWRCVWTSDGTGDTAFWVKP